MTTCPHVRIRRDLRPATCALVIFTLAGCGAKKHDADAPAAPVTVSVATRGAQPHTLSGLGHVVGLDTSSARAQTSGQVLSVSFVEGQSVRAGQPLAQIDPRPLQATLAQDEATLARDRAALANAKDNLNRSAPLVAQGLSSAQQVEGYRSQVAELAAAVAGDRATIRRDSLMLAYTTIRAPIAGVTGIRQIDPGNVVSPNDPNGIVTIAQVQPIAVTFAVPQSATSAIRTAMEKAGPEGLGVDALAQGGGQTLDHGRLTVINNQIDDASGTVLLKAVFPNAARQLWPGQMITARVVLGTAPNVVRVPASAIQRNPQGSFVWIVDARGKAVMRSVVTGIEADDEIVVTRGLSGGERVVTDGQFGLSSGMLVKVTNAGAAKPLKADAPDRLGLQP